MESQDKSLSCQYSALPEDARLRVVLTGILSLAVWQLDSLTGLAIVSALVLSWVFLSRCRVKDMLPGLKKTVYFIAVISLYFCWSEISNSAAGWLEGLEQALLKSLMLGGKLVLLFISALWLYFSTTPTRVVDALTSLLAPLERFRLPVRELSFVVGLILRFFPSSLSSIKELYRYMLMRESLCREPAGSGKKPFRVVSRVIDCMVLQMHSSIHESQMISLGLLSRGYNPFRQLTPATSWRLSLSDLSFFTVSSAAIIITVWFY